MYQDVSRIVIPAVYDDVISEYFIKSMRWIACAMQDFTKNFLALGNTIYLG